MKKLRRPLIIVCPENQALNGESPTLLVKSDWIKPIVTIFIIEKEVCSSIEVCFHDEVLKLAEVIL
jgi:hypothetical protein